MTRDEKGGENKREGGAQVGGEEEAVIDSFPLSGLQRTREKQTARWSHSGTGAELDDGEEAMETGGNKKKGWAAAE